MQRCRLMRQGRCERWNRPILEILITFIVSSIANGLVQPTPTFPNIFGSSRRENLAKPISSIASRTYFRAFSVGYAIAHASRRVAVAG